MVGRVSGLEPRLIDKYRRRSGLKGKIIAKCIDCSYDELDVGTWRQQVEKCGCPDCPLYNVRPLPIGGKYENHE